MPVVQHNPRSASLHECRALTPSNMIHSAESCVIRTALTWLLALAVFDSLAAQSVPTPQPPPPQPVIELSPF
jgi:hypothetical protein